MEFKDYYKTLGLARTASADEIKRAYRKLARKYHPDVSKEPDAEARFKEVAEAHEALHDVERRAAYDVIETRYRQGYGHDAGPGGGAGGFNPPPGWASGLQNGMAFCLAQLGQNRAGNPRAPGHHGRLEHHL